MKRSLIGVGVAVTAYILYRWKTVTEPSINAQGRAAAPSEILTAINLGDPYLYAAAAAGLVGARYLVR